MESTDRFIVVLITTPEGEGESMGRALVEQGLAACVNRIPSVRSIYRWKGSIESDGEDLLVVKTARDRSKKSIRRSLIGLSRSSIAC